MNRQQTDAKPRGRGRPARLSREQIIQAAVDLVYQDPNATLTMKQVADAVGAAPMALYRYFPDRDDLLGAVADRVATDMVARVIELEGVTWQEKLRRWMLFSLESLRPYPQLLPYISHTRHAAWLRSFIVLTEVLRPLRLSEEDQALAIALISTTIVGQATLSARRTPADTMVTVMQEALGEEDEAERRRIEPVLEALPQAFDRLYDTVIDSTIAAIEALATASRGGRARRSPKRVPASLIFSSPDH